MAKRPDKTWLDRGIEFLSPRWGLERQAARMRLELSQQFRDAGHTRLLADWITSSLAATPGKWELDVLRQRSQDLNRNDPVAAGATDTLVTNVIGQGLKLQSRLRAEVLGISEDQAQELRTRIEDLFGRWQAQADAAGRFNFAYLQSLAFRKILEDGEVITNLPFVQNEPWRPVQRAVELIEAERLGTPHGKQGVFQGVELGPERLEPRKYWIRKPDKFASDYQVPRFDWVGIPARDAQGRPLILHTYLAKRPGQVRGWPLFAPALTYFKAMGDYLNAELVAAKISACLAVFVTQNDPLYQAQAAATDTDSKSGLGLEILEPGMITRLRPGEGINILDPKRGGETFSFYLENMLRVIGASAGLPFELLLKNFSKTNYSSARAALLEARRWFMFLRSFFAQAWCQPLFELVLEEAWLRGLLPLDNFYEYQPEYCRSQWIGGAWGWVDPKKEVEASLLAINGGLSTHAKEIAAQGEGWDEVFEQLFREKRYAQALGLALNIPEGWPPQEPEEKEDAETKKE